MPGPRLNQKFRSIPPAMDIKPPYGYSEIVPLTTTARDLGPAHLPEPPGLVTADVSFISLKLALAPALALAAPGAWLVALVKPQFEAGPRGAPKGVVRDEVVRRAAVERVRASAQELGLEVRGEIVSPLTGPAGNVEYLLHMALPSASER